MARPFFDDLRELDRAATDRYEIESKILMENAAAGVKNLLAEKNLLGKKTLIAVGSGDNGADGYALSRMIPNAYLYEALPPKSKLCVLQKQIAKNLQIPFASLDDDFEVIIDAVFGSGLSAPISGDLALLIEALNHKTATKVAVDVPSGVRCGMQKTIRLFVPIIRLRWEPSKHRCFQILQKILSER